MRILLVLLFAAANIHTSAQQNDNFILCGVIKDGYAYKIFLRYSKDDQSAVGIDVEEVAIVKDGKFSFQGFIDEPVQAHLVLDGLSSHAPVYLDTGRFEVTLNVSRVNDITRPYTKIEIASVRGSVSDSLQRQLHSKARKIFQTNNADTVKRNAWYEEVSTFVKAYPNHNLSSEILKESNSLSYKQARTIYNALSASQQAKATRNGVGPFLDRIMKLETRYVFKALPDPSGKLMSGKELVYNYMLVHFWASWAHDDFLPLLSLYKKYNNKGFEILGISIDDEKDEWLNAIKNNNLPWPQISDLKGRQNALYMYYNIPHVPYSFLIDKAGTVISIDPGAEGLKRTLEGLFPL